MLTGNILEMTDEEIDRDVKSLGEWLESWGSAETIPITCVSLRGLLLVVVRLRAERDSAQRRVRNQAPPQCSPRGSMGPILPDPTKQ